MCALPVTFVYQETLLYTLVSLERSGQHLEVWITFLVQYACPESIAPKVQLCPFRVLLAFTAPAVLSIHSIVQVDISARPTHLSLLSVLREHFVRMVLKYRRCVLLEHFALRKVLNRFSVLLVLMLMPTLLLTEPESIIPVKVVHADTSVPIHFVLYVRSVLRDSYALVPYLREPMELHVEIRQIWRAREE
jgi:hypothetical protein